MNIPWLNLPIDAFEELADANGSLPIAYRRQMDIAQTHQRAGRAADPDFAWELYLRIPGEEETLVTAAATGMGEHEHPGQDRVQPIQQKWGPRLHRVESEEEAVLYLRRLING